MKTLFLFPSRFRPIGWILLLAGLVAAIFFAIDNDLLAAPVFAISQSGFVEPVWFGIVRSPLIDEIAVLLITLGCLLTGFARVKDEDEYISSIRYESLVWAMYLNIGILLLSTVFLYHFSYLYFMWLNLIGMLLFFVLRFHFKLYQLRKAMRDEE